MFGIILSRDENPPKNLSQRFKSISVEVNEMDNVSYRFTETVLEGRPSDRPWEGCINSVVYRVPRGVRVRLPEFLAEHIRRTEEEKRQAQARAERLAKAPERII